MLTLTGLGRAVVPVLAALADETDARIRYAGLAWREKIEQVMKWIAAGSTEIHSAGSVPDHPRLP